MAPKLPNFCSAKELCKASFWRDIFAEIMCSLYLVMVVTFAQITFNAKIYSLNMTHVGIMVGFNIYLLIEGYGHISGGHMNPIISFAFMLFGRISFIRAFFYTIAQCIGGVLGSAVAYGVCPSHMRESFAPFLPGPGLGPERAMVVELIFTFSLTYTALSVTSDNLRTVSLPSLPTAFCVGVGIMSAGTWTGICLNPIVALGPAVITKTFKDHWIYWVGSYLGAALAVLVLKVYIMTREKPTPPEESDGLLKKQNDEKQGMLKSEISTLVEQIMDLSAEYKNNVNSSSNKYKGSKASLNNISAV